MTTNPHRETGFAFLEAADYVVAYTPTAASSGPSSWG